MRNKENDPRFGHVETIMRKFLHSAKVLGIRCVSRRAHMRGKNTTVTVLRFQKHRRPEELKLERVAQSTSSIGTRSRSLLLTRPSCSRASPKRVDSTMACPLIKI